MELSLFTVFMTILAGVGSVASPCVLPVVPIVVTGTEADHRYRPIFIVLGLSLTFILMGVITSLFGYLIAGNMLYIEKISGVVVMLLGVLMLFDINIFKKMTIFGKLRPKGRGLFSGFFLGLTLGIVWIPCIGALLSSVLTTVATEGQLLKGVVLLSFYSIGFSIPMLIAGYSTQFFRKKMRVVMENPKIVRYVSSLIMVSFGLYILVKGVVNFGF